MATTEKIGQRKPKPKTKPQSSPKKASGSGYLGKSAIKGIIFAPPGLGKTSFCAQFPKPGFLVDNQERGIFDLVEFGIVPEPVFIEVADDFAEAKQLATDAIDRGINTLVIDSLTGFEKLMFTQYCEEEYNGNWGKDGFYAYQEGPKAAAKSLVPEFIDVLESVVQAGINVLITAHSQIKNFNNPVGSDFDKYSPYVDKETWQFYARWSKMILAIALDVEIKKDRGSVKAKADQESERRVIYTTMSPVWECKNIWGLPPVLEAGDSAEEAYANFEKAFRKAANRGAK